MRTPWSLVPTPLKGAGPSALNSPPPPPRVSGLCLLSGSPAAVLAGIATACSLSLCSALLSSSLPFLVSAYFMVRSIALKHWRVLLLLLFRKKSGPPLQLWNEALSLALSFPLSPNLPFQLTSRCRPVSNPAPSVTLLVSPSPRSHVLLSPHFCSSGSDL